MRDVGRMGESVFSHLCASAGLAANGSKVDRTGWDFLVEFNFASPINIPHLTLHESALECKVQVKSTDSNTRKIQITLLNLKRLATAPLPSFFAFIEFDNKESPQRIFLVHLDFPLITKILRRLHKAEQKKENHLLHKMMMTINYDESHMLCQISGNALSDAIRIHIGDSMASYITKKHAHLTACGFDDGIAELTFSAEGMEEMSQLIDMSIGIEPDAKVYNFKGFNKRFGELYSVPFLNEETAKLSIIDLKPTFSGAIKFRSDPLGPAFTFPAQIFVSPFNGGVTEELRRARISGEFFDLIFNPFTFTSTFKYHISDKALDIKILKDGLNFLEMISSPDCMIFAEIEVPDMPSMKFTLKGSGMQFYFGDELAALDAALQIATQLAIRDNILISLEQAREHSSRLIEMKNFINAPVNAFKLEIPPFEGDFAISKELACVLFLSTMIGNLYLGVFFVMHGNPLTSSSGGMTLLPTSTKIERIVVREYSKNVFGGDLDTATTLIENKYSADYEVLTLFDRNALKSI